MDGGREVIPAGNGWHSIFYQDETGRSSTRTLIRMELFFKAKRTHESGFSYWAAALIHYTHTITVSMCAVCMLISMLKGVKTEWEQVWPNTYPFCN